MPASPGASGALPLHRRRNASYRGFPFPIRYAAYDAGLSTGSGFGGNEAETVGPLHIRV